MYDRFPHIAAGPAEACHTGWPHIIDLIGEALPGVICIECYPGVLLEEIWSKLHQAFPATPICRTEDLFHTPEELAKEIDPLLTEDKVFGRMNDFTIANFFDTTALHCARASLPTSAIVFGTGASLLHDAPSLLVYADMPRWEAQLRQRRGQIANLGAKNFGERPALLYKRAFFLDWRAADRLKQQLHPRIDILLDTTVPDHPKAIYGDIYRAALACIPHRPFRVVPFFDPGPWGGHWMERVCNLPEDGAPNHAWCFDCVPEENSILLAFGIHRVEVPALNLVLAHPRELLGDDICARFGAEFPIRFDFLDTVGGGNLSLQVHPLTAYIREHFGMDYTQDESYYMLDADPEASVYLGLHDNIDPQAMLRDLYEAQDGEHEFNADLYVNRFPARRHDHFLIPAGTVHCSGAGAMVLEISATPYIFTFKLWDWGRLGLDGRPRPIHLDHGAANIQWGRTTDWVKQNLINRFVPVGSGDGWRCERTGLHQLQFIDTFRHWFTGPVDHETHGTLHVLNLVQGEEAIVESPEDAFAPFLIHYAETFIVPAAVGRYRIRPHGRSTGCECATLQASVRREAS